jgi:hypothetical protein
MSIQHQVIGIVLTQLFKVIVQLGVQAEEVDQEFTLLVLEFQVLWGLKILVVVQPVIIQ